MTRLSIIIPAVGRQQQLDDTLLSVLENRPAGCEVLVIHSPAYRDPYGLADEVRFVASPADGCLSGMLNDGVRAARAEVVHWMHPGVGASAGWTDGPLAQLANPRVGLLSPPLLDAAQPQRLVAAGARYQARGCRQLWGAGRDRSWLHTARWPARTGPTLLSGFARIDDPGRVWWNQRFGGWADIDLALRVAAGGRSSEPAQECWLQVHGEAAWALSSEPAGMAERARQAEAFFWTHRDQGRLLAHLLWLTATALFRGRPAACWTHLRASWEGMRSVDPVTSTADARRQPGTWRLDGCHQLPAPPAKLAGNSPSRLSDG